MPSGYQILVGVGIAAYLVQGVALGQILYNSEKTFEKATYLASVVEKNIEHLDEFDLIALQDLGLLKNA